MCSLCEGLNPAISTGVATEACVTCDGGGYIYFETEANGRILDDYRKCPSCDGSGESTYAV